MVYMAIPLTTGIVSIFAVLLVNCLFWTLSPQTLFEVGVGYDAFLAFLLFDLLSNIFIQLGSCRALRRGQPAPPQHT
jgi:hypothetical protein